jgi:NitT/TauT family transport system ATP-binding protein
MVTQTTGAAVDVLGVTQAFRSSGQDLLVLDDVSISAKPGEFVALVGPSGSGKSTLLRLLAGLDKPLFGQVFVNGSAVRGPDPDRALVFQDPTLLPWRTVRQNVALGPQARGTLRDSADAIDEVIEAVGLTEFAGAWPSQLSGGMAQRTALARALVGEPSLLLLDEPLGKLDALTRRILQGKLLELWARNNPTAILVTHDVSEALLLADRVLVFSPRPARIREEVRVDLPRPRDEAAPEFVALRQRILDLLDNDADSAASQHPEESRTT